MDTGVNFVSKLVQTLWYLVPHHEKLANRFAAYCTRDTMTSKRRKKRSFDSILMVYSSTLNS